MFSFISVHSVAKLVGAVVDQVPIHLTSNSVFDIYIAIIANCVRWGFSPYINPTHLVRY
nr:MAG TPA: hypothetical protein [Caudoviricetes sp.]